MFLWNLNIRSQGWMCKKQTSVSHSSAESEAVSLDAGLRMDGIPALGTTFSVCSTTWTFRISSTSSSQTVSKRLMQQEGPEIKTIVEFGVEDCRSVSNSAGFECILHPGDTQRKMFKFDLTSTGKLAARDTNENTASSFQVWQADVNPSSSTVKLVAERRPKSSHWYNLVSPQLDDIRNSVGHLEKVHSNVRQQLGRQPEDEMPELDVNTTMIWGILMSATMKAAAHLGLREDHVIVQYFTELDSGSKSSNLLDTHDKLEYNSMDQNHFVERQSCQAVDSKGIRFL